jgi:hypothetical protein
MTDVSRRPVVRHDVETGTGSGDAASGAAGWLAFAAAPTFAVMAVWTGAFGDRPDMLCTAMPDASPLSAMALMYALMSAFHAPPWLKLVFRRWRGGPGHRSPGDRSPGRHERGRVISGTSASFQKLSSIITPSGS